MDIGIMGLFVGLLLVALGASGVFLLRRRVHSVESLLRQIMRAMNLPGRE